MIFYHISHLHIYHYSIHFVPPSLHSLTGPVDSLLWLVVRLVDNTCLDITFAVSQVCYFTSNPKESCTNNVKLILRYLKGTSDKSLIIKPYNTYNLNCWVNADFARLYCRELGNNPNSAKSCYEPITVCGGVHVYYKLQLSSEIYLSTLQAKYVRLVMAYWAFIPVRWLVISMLEFLRKPSKISPTNPL